MEKYYGMLPVDIGEVNVFPTEMMFYQYLPIKMAGDLTTTIEQRLKFIEPILNVVMWDFSDIKGLIRYRWNYMYLTIKYMYQIGGCSFNRSGWHSDGFMTDDINYIWYDSAPTIFNTSKFNLTQDDILSMKEMDEQALPENDVVFPEKHLLRLDQFNIHKVNTDYSGMRLFVKVSFSKEKYDLEGNSHNYLMDYDWQMRPRSIERNVPQNIKE